MAEIGWTFQAIEDIDNIAGFIAKDSVKYASIQVNRFFDQVEVLKSQINSGRIVPELGNPAIRELILGNYRIIYRIVSSKRVDIVTVHHS